MYSQFRNEILAELSETESLTIDSIAEHLDKVAKHYDITRKTTALVQTENPIPDTVRIYIACKKIEGLSDQTLYNYSHNLANFFMEVRKEPATITTNDIRLYLYAYKEARQVSNRSLQKVEQSITSYFAWLVNEGYIDKDPARNLPKIKYEEKPRQALSQIQMEYVRMACQTPREKAMVEFMYSTGCRVTELCNLKMTDIDFETKKVHLFGKGNKHRFSFLNAKAEVKLKEYLNTRKDNDEHVFVSEYKPHHQLKKDAVEWIIRNISNQMPEGTPKITPHTFRHTMATTAVNNGMPVESIQLVLGHASINTTMIYAHSDLQDAQNQHAKTVI